MELTTFGAIMKFAMDGEEEIVNTLEGLAGNADLPSFGGLLDRIISESKKSRKLLERTRREGINEVILHPITGLDSDNYSLQDPPTGDLTSREVGKYLTETSDRLIRFYTDAAPKITNPEAMRVFKRLAARRLELKEAINAYLAGLE
jgi:rubrerythrin